MIELGKQYKTRDGREVRIYAVDAGGHRPIHGAIREGQEWFACTWLHDGVAGLHCNALIEVKPRIKREVWVNVYPGPIVCELRHTKADADDDAMRNRIACVKVVIDCEEGEGL
jgi:hypothetical protein